jgi:hypothetical protein
MAAHMGMFEQGSDLHRWFSAVGSDPRPESAIDDLPQIKLTYGRRVLRLHQHPAFGGWAQVAGTVLSVGC